MRTQRLRSIQRQNRLLPRPSTRGSSGLRGHLGKSCGKCVHWQPVRNRKDGVTSPGAILVSALDDIAEDMTAGPSSHRLSFTLEARHPESQVRRRIAGGPAAQANVTARRNPPPPAGCSEPPTLVGIGIA